MKAHETLWTVMVAVAVTVSLGLRLLARWRMRRTDARIEAVGRRMMTNDGGPESTP